MLITEALTGQEFVLTLSQYYFNIPVIVLQHYATNVVANDVMGNAGSYLDTPDLCSDHSGYLGTNTHTEMVQRLSNWLKQFHHLYKYHMSHLYNVDSWIQTYFINFNSVKEQMERIVLIFTNDHAQAEFVQPRPPNIVPIGGIGLGGKPKILPQAVQKRIAVATIGFFLISIDLSNEVLASEFSYDFVIQLAKDLGMKGIETIWVGPYESTENSDILILSDVAIKDLLAHPACLLYITEANRMSKNEAMYYGVPVVAFPYTFDQFRNAKLLETMEMGITMAFQDLRALDNVTIIADILIDATKLAGNANAVSRVYRDLPVSPEDTLLYWVDLLLLHPNVKETMRLKTSKYSWFKQPRFYIYLCLLFPLCLFMYSVYEATVFSKAYWTPFFNLVTYFVGLYLRHARIFRRYHTN